MSILNPNTEDKDWWVHYGEYLEWYFLTCIAPRLPMIVRINPDKWFNPTVPDFLCNGFIADLKVQYTPFFKAGEMYGVPSQYAVSFNIEDYDRYLESYPQIQILFYVNWSILKQTFGGKVYAVHPLHGVWYTNFERLKIMVDAGANQHVYKRRRDDFAGNARGSYCFDLRNFQQLEDLTSEV